MVKQAVPQNASQWASFLVNKKLPVRASVLARLKKKFEQSNIALMELNKTIKSDPVLCLHVVTLAGTLHQEKESEVTSIDHAISSLGITRLEELIGSLPEIRLSPKSVAHKMYFRSIANSHHAATQVQQWLEQNRGGLFAQESYLAALFYGVGHWMLWSFAPLHMSQIQSNIREQGLPFEQAEKEVLGCTISALTEKLLNRWHTSPLALATLQQADPVQKQFMTKLHQRALGDPRLDGDDLRELNHLTQQKFFPVKLANLLALNAPYGWGTSQALLIIDIINDYLKDDLKQTMARLHRNCALSAQRYHVVGTLAPATEMLMLPSELQAGYKLSDAETEHFAKSCPAPLKEQKSEAVPVENITTPEQPEFLDQQLYNGILQKFLKQADSYPQASAVLDDLFKAVTEGIGLNRAALNIVSVKDKTVKVIRTEGFESGHPLTSSSHQLASNSLFLRLYEKNSCMMVNESNRMRIKSMLPGSYSQHISDSNYLLMSIFVGNKPIAVVYADREGEAGGAQDFHHEKFKQLCAATGLCLKTVMQQRASKQS